MDDEVGVERATGDHRQFDLVDEVADADGDHPDAALAADSRLDGRQLGKHVRVAVADEHGDVRHALAVAVLTLELDFVDEPQRVLRLSPVAKVRHASYRLNHVLLHLSRILTA